MSIAKEQELINRQIQEIRREFLSNHPECRDNPKVHFNENYREGIIDFECYQKCDPDKRILWILKEPNTASFSPGCFARYETFKKQKTNRTFKLIAKCSYYLINGIYTEDDKKLAEVMKYIALINIKKTPGGKTTNQKVLEEFFHQHKDLLLKQIQMIDPTVVIVANEMNLLSPALNLSSCGKENIDYVDFSTSRKKRAYKFRNKLFISAYHPNAKIKHRAYADAIFKVHQKWLGETNTLPEFKAL